MKKTNSLKAKMENKFELKKQELIEQKMIHEENARQVEKHWNDKMALKQNIRDKVIGSLKNSDQKKKESSAPMSHWQT